MVEGYTGVREVTMVMVGVANRIGVENIKAGCWRRRTRVGSNLKSLQNGEKNSGRMINCKNAANW